MIRCGWYWLAKDGDDWTVYDDQDDCLYWSRDLWRAQQYARDLTERDRRCIRDNLY